MIVIQTTLDQRAMTALARVTRKTLRRGSSFPVRTLAWFVVVLEAFLTMSYIRGGFGTWLPNTLMGALMLGCLLLEDRISGAVRLRQIPAEDRVANTTFQENICYVRRTQSGESWQLYTQIKAAAETKDCFVLLTDRRNGQVYPKCDFTMGTPEQFRTLIEKKTGLKIQKFC